MAFRSFFFIGSVLLPLFSGQAFGQTAREYLITARRSGAIQFRDPTTLDIVSSIDVALPTNSTGINGVSADPDGRTLYIEGPEHELADPGSAGGCCWLYSIDLVTAQAKVVSGIWGTGSRRRFVNAGPSLLAPFSEAALSATRAKDDRWQISPDGRWWAGLRSGPNVDLLKVDLYDASRQRIVKSFTADCSTTDCYLNGAWIKDQFYIYTSHDGGGWLWHFAPDSGRLESPIAAPGPAPIAGCENAVVLTHMDAVGDRLVMFEEFGGKIDRRQRCQSVAGGAWIMDPASPQAVISVLPEFYFWQLTPSPDGASLYGVTSDAPEVGSPSQLVYLDARSGKTFRTRPLERDTWWVADVSLRYVPSGEKSVVLPTVYIP